jgi:serine/threonine protein kinase
MAAQFQDISRLDCSEIDISFNLTAGTVTELDDEDFLTSVKIIAEADNNLQAVRDRKNKLVFIAQTKTDVSKIIIKGEEYRVIGHAGNGTYGATCIVAKDNPDGTESRFVLKEQTSTTDDLRIIKEAIINFALNKVSTFFPKIYSVFYSVRNGKDRLYFLCECLAVDGLKLLNAAPNVTKGNIILWIFRELLDRLKELFVNYAFNHGDLKLSNVMVDHNNQLRLIDFGLSRIVLDNLQAGKVIIEPSTFNTTSSASKDLTLMATTTNLSFKSYLVDPCKTFIDTIDNGFNCRVYPKPWLLWPTLPLSDANAGKQIQCGTDILKSASDVYLYNNTHINPAGTFYIVRNSYKGWALLTPPNLTAMGFRPKASPSPRPSQPGGARLRRKTKSKHRKNQKIQVITL